MRNRVSPGTADNQEKQTLGQRAAGLAFRSRRRLATGVAVVIAFFLGYHVIFGQNGLTVYQQKRLEDRTLSRQIKAIQEENSQLKGHVERLQNSPDAIEHEAREKLHYTRPGEVIYTLDEKTETPRNNKPATGIASPGDSQTPVKSAQQ